MLQMQSIFNHLKLTKRYFVNAARYAACVKLEAIKKKKTPYKMKEQQLTCVNPLTRKRPCRLPDNSYLYTVPNSASLIGRSRYEFNFLL